MKGLRRRLGTGPAEKPFDQMLVELDPTRKPKGDSTVADPNAKSSPTTPGDTSAASAASEAPESPAKSASAVVMTGSIDANDPVTRLLHAGQFEKALAETDQLIAGKELRLAMRLYQRGLAQLYLAERSDNRRLFLDAGLSFMRLAIYFRKSSYMGPALVEAGVVHERIGRHELAMKLWRKAQVEIDPETDPAVAQRLEIMLGGTDR